MQEFQACRTKSTNQRARVHLYDRDLFSHARLRDERIVKTRCGAYVATVVCDEVSSMELCAMCVGRIPFALLASDIGVDRLVR